MKRKCIVVLCSTVTAAVILLNVLTYGKKWTSSERIVLNDKSIVLDETIKKIYFQSWNDTITPYTTEFLIDGGDICKVSPPPFLLIFVMSLPGNAEERQTIRKTWGSVAINNYFNFNFSAKMVFMLGRMGDGTNLNTSLQEESVQFKDIVQIDFIESRYNLTRKMMDGLRWIKTYCGSVKYILKADDDTFINVARLSSYMWTTSNINQRTIHGFLINAPPVMREGKYAVKMEELPSSHYPPYVSGTAYILPYDVISDMLDLAEKVPYCPVDDAFMTGVLRVILNISLQHSKYYTHMGETKFSPCEFHSKIAVTNINTKCMYMLWNLATQTGRIDCTQSTLYNTNICPIF